MNIESVQPIMRSTLNFATGPYDGRVSKCGDAMMRTALYEAAQVLLTRTQTWS